jgi:hypothetical protein
MLVAAPVVRQRCFCLPNRVIRPFACH